MSKATIEELKKLAERYGKDADFSLGDIVMLKPGFTIGNPHFGPNDIGVIVDWNSKYDSPGSRDSAEYLVTVGVKGPDDAFRIFEESPFFFQMYELPEPVNADCEPRKLNVVIEVTSATARDGLPAKIRTQDGEMIGKVCLSDSSEHVWTATLFVSSAITYDGHGDTPEAAIGDALATAQNAARMLLLCSYGMEKKLFG